MKKIFALAALLAASLSLPTLASAAEIDVLFVIDNSGSMGEEQVNLLAGFPVFLTELESIDGTLPDVHVGVISSNVGAGGFAITNCGANGDDGVLQNLARAPGCTPPTDFYISDVAGPGGARVVNYTGTFSETFSCIAQLGTSGCGFEQHLESLRRSLDGSNPQNAGFLRAGAYLVVIVLADEDDCSASDGAVYDPTQTSITDPLGPLSSFRCTEFGVQCLTPTVDISRTPASYTGCTAKVASPYIAHPTVYADFLKSLKADASTIFVAAIAGNGDPVAVALDGMSGNPQLQPSCTSMAGSAVPAVRLVAFLNEFPGRNAFTSICGDASANMVTIGEGVKAMVLGTVPGGADAGPSADASVPMPDAGGPGGADAATPGGADAATPGNPDAGGGGGGGDDGCGCRAGGARQAPVAPMLGLLPLLGLALVLRRFRRR